VSWPGKEAKLQKGAGAVRPSDAAPLEHDFSYLTKWLGILSEGPTRRALRYDLSLKLEPAASRLAVRGRVTLVAEPRLPEHLRFLLSPNLGPELVVDTPCLPSRDGALVSLELPDGVGTERPAALGFSYRGRLPEAWVSRESTELALYNLWYPLFSPSLEPFSFRLAVTVTPDIIPVVNGRLVPLPGGGQPAVPDGQAGVLDSQDCPLQDRAGASPDQSDPPPDHADAPRTYIWESTGLTMDIVVCAGPYLVHEERFGPLAMEVYAQLDDYDIAEAYLEAAARVLPVLERWFGPLETVTPSNDAHSAAGPGSCGAPRLAVAVPPRSNWGGYSRPNLIVAPQPLSSGLRDPDRATEVAAFLAHEMGHLWYGSGVLSDTVNEPWVSEAFAEFARLVFIEAELGREAYHHRLRRYAEAVAGASDPRPMREVSTAHPEMDILARRRGALMLAELREKAGDPLMAKILGEFAARHAGRTVRGEDFVREACMTAGVDLREFFSSYLDGPPAGPPRGVDV